MDFEVIVVGAGIVGSVLACSLAKQGVEVCLIDSKNPFEIDNASKFPSRTTALNLGSIDLFSQLGLWNSLQDLATDFNKIYVWDKEGSSRLEFSAKDIDREKLGSIIANNYIYGEVSKILRSSKNINLEFNNGLEDISVNDNSVEVITNDGKKLVSKLLVGADSSLSKVRQLLHIPISTWSYNQTAFVASLRSEIPHNNTAWQVFTSLGPIALLPFDNGKETNLSLVWSAENSYAKKLKSLDNIQFVSELEKETEFILGKLELKSGYSTFPLNQLHAKNYFSQRTVIIGDAAHTIHPLAGQGLNMSFADVLNLNEVIVLSRRRGQDIGSDQVLSKYEHLRKIPNLSVTALMEVFKQGFDSTNPWITLGRNLAFEATQEIHWIKRKFIKEAVGIS